MSQYNLGQAVMVHRGAYNAETNYDLLNIVSHKGGAFFCIQAGTGHEPGTAGGAAYWHTITKGIDNVSLSASDGTVTMVVTFSDATTYTATYPTTAIADGYIELSMLASDFVLPVSKGGTGGTTITQSRGNLYAQQVHVPEAVTLQTASWSGTTQTVGVTAMTTTATVIIAPAPTSRDTWGDYGVYCSAQGTGTLTFSCATVPPTDITVNVAMFEVGAGSDPEAYIQDMIGGAY